MSLGCVYIQNGTGSGGGGGGGSENCPAVQPGACPEPQFAYDPNANDPSAIYPDMTAYGDFIVGRMEPFARNTVCKSVLVALQGSGGCSHPGDTLGVAIFDEAGEVPTKAPSAFLIHWDDKNTSNTTWQGVQMFKLPYESHHACGEHPFVGTRLAYSVCPALHAATCDSTNGFRWIAKEGQWQTGAVLKVATQVIVGLADCSPE